MITDIAFTDINKDDRGDIVIVGEWMPISVFLNQDSNWKFISNDIGLQETSGIWQNIETTDLNNDGVPDLIVGNMGLNGFYKPKMKYYLNDFDKNGRLEAIFTYSINNEDFPIHDKDELIKQLPNLKKDLLYYRDYSNKTIQDIFDIDQLDNSLIRKIDETRSMIFMSDDINSYLKVPMPQEVQYSSVHALDLYDINSDGQMDLLLGGNQYLVKPQYGAFDASKGWILYGNQESNSGFDSLSSLNIYGEIRDFSIVPATKSSDSLFLLAGISNSEIIIKNVK